MITPSKSRSKRKQDEMGRIVVDIALANHEDVILSNAGLLAPEKIRRVTIPGVVDTGATLLSLPARLVRQLGLTKRSTKRVRNTTGTHDVDVYGTVRLTIAGRDCPTDVIEVPDDTPVLIGQIPLEYLDFVVDLRNHRLIGNPEHGGEHMFELYLNETR